MLTVTTTQRSEFGIKKYYNAKYTCTKLTAASSTTLTSYQAFYQHFLSANPTAN